ncbi:MAG: hypothetical protein LQ345_001826 [Seirophora villosa]|nr:MAG: hypothetical protein LQ345_001826 [Seirophora villosa]
MPSPSPSGFLSLPHELRDMIYQYYVFEPDGYHFDLASGKLRASGNRPINLALMYTCTLVAAEMHHLALQSNVLNFSTSITPSAIERKKAAHFDIIFARIESGRADALASLKLDSTFHRYKTPDVDAKVALAYPQFESLLCQMYDAKWSRHLISAAVGKGGRGSSWGEADSAFRALQRHMIELLSRDTEFPEALASFNDYLVRHPPYDPNLHVFEEVWDAEERARCKKAYLEEQQQYGREKSSLLRSGLLQSGPEAWHIPSEDELTEIHKSMGLSYREYAQARLDLPQSSSSAAESEAWERVHWRFSAAAAAIYFFKSVSQSTCLGVRKVVLHEERRSVAHPESHVLGLIPFCLQNPQLHIERRVNIWRMLFGRLFGESVDEYADRLETMSGGSESYRWDWHDRHCAHQIGRNCCRWITEASALSAKGMPADSFSLVLDGDPSCDQSSEVFEMCKEEAAWQVAQDRWYTAQSLSPGFIAKRNGGFYMSEVFPQAMNDIVEGKSFISCNFSTGSPYDPERVLDRNGHFTHDSQTDAKISFPGASWVRAWVIHRHDNRFRPSRPLPALLADLALEDLIAEDEDDAA